jgi:uncharacterized protein (TIGR02246 family)
MKPLAALLGTAVIALMASACNKPADSHNTDVQAIKDNEAQWNLDWQSKVPEKIASHFADDGVLMVQGMDDITGKDAIVGALKQMVADPALSMKFSASKIDVARSGDLAFSQGSYTLTLTDPQTKQLINDHGSYVTAYRKQSDGTWKAVSDIAVSEVPPAAPQAVPPKKH